ncbi:MAG: DUF3379 family protein [Vibrio sp.]
MDDLEFRRRLLSDPNSISDDILDKVHSDHKHKKYVENLCSLDQDIERAMNVDVPDDLADKILSKTMPQKSELRFSKRAFAVAASFIFIFGLLVGQVNWRNVFVQPAQASLEEMAIYHLTKDEQLTRDTDENNSNIALQAKLNPYSYELAKEFPYHIYYLNHCGFNSAHHALHMIFQGDIGRVTAFISNIATEKTQKFTEANMHGEITPLQNGSLVLVGEDGENISEISKVIAPLFQYKI